MKLVKRSVDLSEEADGLINRIIRVLNSNRRAVLEQLIYEKARELGLWRGEIPVDHRPPRLNQAAPSQYRGVQYLKNRNRWVAAIVINGQRHGTGKTYLDPREAAIAYNELARQLLGERAILNHIEGEPS